MWRKLEMKPCTCESMRRVYVSSLCMINCMNKSEHCIIILAAQVSVWSSDFSNQTCRSGFTMYFIQFSLWSKNTDQNSRFIFSRGKFILFLAAFFCLFKFYMQRLKIQILNQDKWQGDDYVFFPVIWNISSLNHSSQSRLF